MVVSGVLFGGVLHYIYNVAFFWRVRVVFCRGTPPFNTIGDPY